MPPDFMRRVRLVVYVLLIYSVLTLAGLLAAFIDPDWLGNEEGAWIQALATVFAGFIAAIAAILLAAVGYQLREQLELGIAGKRWGSYAGLLELLGGLPVGGDTLDRKARGELAARLTWWYYKDGNGLFLTATSQRLFVRLRNNLEAQPDAVEPDSWKGLARDDDCLSLLLQRQASLLRTQLKLDCGVYFKREVSSDPAYAPFDVDFLAPEPVRKAETKVTGGEAKLPGGWSHVEIYEKDADAYLEKLREKAGLRRTSRLVHHPRDQQWYARATAPLVEGVKHLRVIGPWLRRTRGGSAGSGGHLPVE